VRKATLLLITLAVCGYPIVVTDIDDEKTVVVLVDDSRDSVRVDPAEVIPLPIPVLVID
jgi:hypothetical protein